MGEVVQVACDAFFPADLLLLASAHADGTAYVETVNLDGESNLKLKRALDATRLLPADGVARLQARPPVAPPDLHGMQGSHPKLHPCAVQPRHEQGLPVPRAAP